jgi:hypothetical protein
MGIRIKRTRDHGKFLQILTNVEACSRVGILAVFRRKKRTRLGTFNDSLYVRRFSQKIF